MPTNVFIFHGTAGHPQEHWFPWLKRELENRGLEVFVPQFPTPEGQSLQAWLEVLKPLRDKIDADAILIGHSLGGLFTLKLLERLKQPVRLAVLVSAPIGVGWIKNYEQDKKFDGFEFNWEKIKSNAKNFIAYHSDNDPYVSLENGRELAKHLGIELTFISNAGHFNTSTKFSDLLAKIQTSLQASK